jgi:HEAT repeat protein
MRAMKGIAAALILAALPLASAQAHVNWAVGINLGAPFFYHPCYHCYEPYYYYRPYPVYVAQPAVVVQPAPVYQVAPAPQPAYSSPAEAAPPTVPPPPVPATVTAQPAAWAPDAAEAQLQRLNAADDQARADAAVQLGRMKATRAVPPLERLLSGDRSAAVREAAARGLGLIGSPDALPALQRAAQADDDRDVRHSAQFAAEVIRSGLPR